MIERRKSRETALQYLFQNEFEVKNSFQQFLQNFDADPGDKEYSKKIAEGVQTNREQIDQIIQKYSKNWKINRMSTVDRNILRVAIFEIKFLSQEIPYKASINEALEIAKKYSQNESNQFINGILDQVAKNEVT